MARKLQDIKKEIADEYLSDLTIREKYGLVEGDTFESAFSKVSIENILFSCIATAIYALEVIFDALKFDVDQKIASAVVASIPWYHKISLEYQDGDPLVYDEETNEYRYAVDDETKRVVKYVAVRDNNGTVLVLASGETSGRPSKLADDVLARFTAYLKKRKPAGIVVDVASRNPDYIKFNADVEYDDQVLASDGTLIAEPSVKPVQEAVENYLKNIVYGGVFNTTKLVDAIQGAQGVKDVRLKTVWHKKDGDAEYAKVTTNNKASFGGSFVFDNTASTIAYKLAID